MFGSRYASSVRWLTLAVMITAGCATDDRTVETTSTSTSALTYQCPASPPYLNGAANGSDWITGVVPSHIVHDSDVFWGNPEGFQGMTQATEQGWIHCEFAYARLGNGDGYGNYCSPSPADICSGGNCPKVIPDIVELESQALAAAQMYDQLAPVDACRANQYLEFLRVQATELLSWRDDQQPNPQPDHFRNRYMAAWGAYDDTRNGQWADDLLVAGRLSYPMAAFAKRVAANPSAFSAQYQQDAIRFTTAIMETYSSFSPELRVQGAWIYHIWPSAYSTLNCNTVPAADQQSCNELKGDAGYAEGWNQDMAFARTIAEAAQAADSALYRASPASTEKSLTLQILTIDAPRHIAMNVQFFVDYLNARQHTVGGAIYYLWNKKYNTETAAGQLIENTGHAQVEVGALALIYENRVALDGMLQRAGYAERVSASVPVNVLQRLATTFTQIIWRNNVISVNVDGTSPSGGNSNKDIKGFTTLSPYNVLVWTRARDSMFAAGSFPGALVEEGWSALLRYEPGSTNVGKTPPEVISVGDSYGCMIASGGRLYCWGDNSRGQLGIGSTTAYSTPVLVVSSNVVSVSVSKGGLTTCAIIAQSTPPRMYCWGDNSYGQLGFTSTNGYETLPVRVDTRGPWPNEDAVNVAVGSRHVCETVKSGTLWCAGDNTYGQLGRDVFGGSTAPQQVTNIAANVTNVSAAFYTTCAGGAAASWCWGYNPTGQVGNGTTTSTPTPQLLNGMWAVRTGGNHTCGVNTNDSGKIYCWGYNYHGEVGDLTTTQRTSPVAVAPASTDYLAVRHSTSDIYPRVDVGDYHTCAYGQAGAGIQDLLYCWGWGYSGQMGQGGDQTSCGYPDSACDLHNPTKLNMGSMPSPADFAVGGNTSFGGWGNGPQPFGLNSYSQLGLGNTANQYYVWPYTIGGLTF